MYSQSCSRYLPENIRYDRLWLQLYIYVSQIEYDHVQIFRQIIAQSQNPTSLIKQRKIPKPSILQTHTHRKAQHALPCCSLSLFIHPSLPFCYAADEECSLG
ncbi:hypothetical protein M419DRAFT_122626 [Trichoderma reesei RUT C-30]|uniref:Uncharacterized protein n=1 Tax=Hypocrea jecorina (strain ATCC 56765 / BCRC 32924 / NRRL 11460 / Rut C-30) TaxID=1344414 RepID=A0A024SIN8_HYPJR|nr:hypothetical protein M419DRAFT_122626 [Trichoderma reesei RUT C-30]